MRKSLAFLNEIARRELAQHRHRYTRVLCKPHPHLGPHRVGCECGAARPLAYNGGKFPAKAKGG